MVISSSRKKSRLLFLFVAFFSFALGAKAIDFMELKEVKPGMKGVGKTVFTGTKVEEFDVEIIDILKNFISKKDLILVRISGKIVDEAGVIEGMSGSPVYINGKLIGALSYKFGSFTKEPIGGITPIEDMIRIFESGEEQGSIHSGTHGLVPIQTPLSVAGLHPEIFGDIEDEFSKFGFIPVHSGNFQNDISDSVILEPGGVIGFSLIRGDAEMSGIGTLTSIEGNRVIGFGHGVFHAGEVEMPLVGGYVHSVIPSSYLSYKLASGSRVIGTLTQDRVVGVGGILNEDTRLIPVVVNVGNRQREDAYHYELVQYKLFTPLLVNWVTRNSLRSSAGLTGDFTIRGDMEITIEGGKELHMHNIFAGGQAVNDLGRWVYEPVEELLNNEFEERKIEKIRLDITMKEEVEKARITSVKLNKTLLDRSDTLQVEVNLTPLSDKPYIEKFEFAVIGIPEGSVLEVLVSSSDAIISMQMERWPEKFIPVDFNHLLRIIENSGASDELEVQVVVSDEVVQVDGVDLPSLPASVRNLYRSNKVADRTSVTKGYPLLSVKRRVPYSISGFKGVKVRMEEPPEKPAEENQERERK